MFVSQSKSFSVLWFPISSCPPENRADLCLTRIKKEHKEWQALPDRAWAVDKAEVDEKSGERGVDAVVARFVGRSKDEEGWQVERRGKGAEKGTK